MFHSISFFIISGKHKKRKVDDEQSNVQEGTSLLLDQSREYITYEEGT